MKSTVTEQHTRTTYSRPGGDRRGNSKDRARRKLWMLKTWGDGSTCPCVHCGTELDYDTVQADRIIPGGTYTQDNVQPACRSCNAERSDYIDWVSPLVREALAVLEAANA